jgi:hypothetical protein
MKILPLFRNINTRLLKTVIFINNSSTPVRIRIRVMSGFGTTTILNKPISRWCMCNFSTNSQFYNGGIRTISCEQQFFRILIETPDTIVVLISDDHAPSVTLEMLAVATMVHAQHLSGGKFDVSSFPKYVQHWLDDWFHLRIKVWKLHTNGSHSRFIGRVTCSHTY